MLFRSPSYLNPFTAPQVLQVKDLPEGQYSLSIRVRDLSGLWSPWSDVSNVNIDRGFPVVGTQYSIAAANPSSIQVALNDTKDDGVGLCTTQLVNPEGWIWSTSALKVKPLLTLPGNTVQSSKLQVFDCLGNGREGSLAAKTVFTPAASISKSGRWSAASSDFPAGSMKCVGTCTMYLSAKGTLGAIVGSGAVDVSAGSASIKGVKGSKTGGLYGAASLYLGDRKTSVKISGTNFTLVGIATAELKISSLVNTQNSSTDQDPSLDDAVQKSLNKYGFNSGDFTPDWSVLPMVRGTTLEDPTLDLCSANFDSELLRKERRQISVAKSGNPYLFLSSETVRYKKIGRAHV